VPAEAFSDIAPPAFFTTWNLTEIAIKVFRAIGEQKPSGPAPVDILRRKVEQKQLVHFGSGEVLVDQ
jgi:hypothetical protein